MLKAKFYFYNSKEMNEAIKKFSRFYIKITNVDEANFIITAEFEQLIERYFLEALTKPTKVKEIEE